MQLKGLAEIKVFNSKNFTTMLNLQSSALTEGKQASFVIYTDVYYSFPHHLIYD